MARPVEEPRTGERIAKLLARAGIASRREVERMIAEGRIARDGVAIETAATVLPSLAGVTVDGNPVAAPEPARLFLYHKPTGLLVTERDPRGRPTIYDRLPKDLPRLVPVGRLDLNTEGLLLLTTDGGFKRELELPATGVERTYRARAYGRVSQAQLEELIHGVEIDGIRYGSIDANLERRTGANFWIEMTLTEGKNREVRRILDYLGLEVSRLIRTRYGPFVLGDLPPGEIGEVRQPDLTGFRHTLANRRKDDTRIAVQGTVARAPRAARSSTRPPSLPPSLPGAGRGPVTERKSGRPASPRAAVAPDTRSKPRTIHPKPTASQLGPGLRRVGTDGAASPRAPSGRAAQPSAPRAASLSHRERVGAAKPRKGEGEPAPATDRPAKPQRKPGWAKAKPKPGARPPRKR